MASVNFLKCKAGTGTAGAMIRHCDKDERLRHDHANEQIDKGLTEQNRQIRGGYKETMTALAKRLDELDRQPGANRRKDRVEMMMLEASCPDGMKPAIFAEIALQEIERQYGARNVMNAYLHMDEIHQYMDHGELKMSRPHLHVAVVPEIGGKLNGKEFSSREQMIRLNQSIDGRCRELGYRFLTGERPRNKSVEELKVESVRELAATARTASKEAAEAKNQLTEAREELRSVRSQFETEKSILGQFRASQHPIKKKLGGREVVELAPETVRALERAADRVDRAGEIIRQRDRILGSAKAEAEKTVQKAQAAADKIEREANSERLRRMKDIARWKDLEKHFPETFAKMDAQLEEYRHAKERSHPHRSR